MKTLLTAATALALGLAACSPAPADNQAGANDMTAADPGVVDTGAAPAPAPAATPTPDPGAPAAADTLTLEGLGPLRIGEAVPADSGWKPRGAQVSDACTTVTSPDHPGVYAIVEGGKVRRVTVGQRSDVKLVEGIGVGATEKEVTAAFPGFRSTPHKYEAAPAKYLTAPNADSGDPALRFEIGADGKVSLIHVGTKPVLFYVEGCA